MTDDEFKLYRKICQSYDDVNFKGADLFFDLFETDDNGIITMLKPPSIRATSMEIFLFLMTLQQQQHIRLMYAHIDDLAQQIKTKLKEFEEKINS